MPVHQGGRPGRVVVPENHGLVDVSVPAIATVHAKNWTTSLYAKPLAQTGL
jgi:hypothetical protein